MRLPRLTPQLTLSAAAALFPLWLATAARAVEATSTPAASSDKVESLAQALIARLAKCWEVPPGSHDGKQIRVSIRVDFKPDGTLASNPTVINPDTHPDFEAFARSAASAITKCAAYGDTLPSDSYESWRSLTVHFVN